MATLNLWNYFSLVSQGVEKTGKQGSATDAPQTPFPVTVTGSCLQETWVLPTATVVTIFDDDDDKPVDFDFCHLWSDQDVYVQVIGSGTNAIFKMLAKVPFTLTYDSILAAANTTPIAGGTEPTLTDIDSIVIGNYSGSDANIVASFVD